MTVALLGGENDPQIRAVGRELDALDQPWEIWNAENWPGESPLAVEVDGGTSLTVTEELSPSAVDAVYLRRISFDPRGPEFEGELEERPYSLVNQLREYRGLVLSALRYLDTAGVPIVNPPETLGLHGLKPYQTALFEDAGLPVPATLATNDPDRVATFHDRVDEVVYKPVGGGGHARLLTETELTGDRLDRLANAPVQFQERLSGTNHRLFVVDGEVVATGRIESDELDYRLGEHDVTAADLAADIEDAAVRAADVLGLRFAGVDVVVDDDSFGVLEANPSPMFATFDELAGTDVAGQLAASLAP